MIKELELEKICKEQPKEQIIINGWKMLPSKVAVKSANGGVTINPLTPEYIDIIKKKIKQMVQ